MAKTYSAGFSIKEFKTPTKGQVRFRARVKKAGVDLNRAFPTKEEANDWALDLLNKINDGTFASNQQIRRMTVAQAIKEQTGRGKEDLDRNQDLRVRLQFWADEIGHKKLIDVRRSDIEACLRKLETEPKKHGGTKVVVKGGTRAPATINRYLSAISRVFKAYVDADGGLHRNPCSGLKRRENNMRRRWLSKAEADRLVEACRESKWDRLVLLVQIALCSGGRVNEILGATWKDVHWGDGYAQIYVGETKNGEPKMLQVLGDAFAELRRWHNEGGTWVFPSPMDGVPYRNYRPHFLAALKAAEIEDFRFHDLRHTTASWLVQSGVSDYQVQNILGHSSPAMMKRYAHLRTEDHRAALNKVFSDD